MLWGFISPWAKSTYDKERPTPFNARSETIGEKNYLVEVGTQKVLNTCKWFFC
tara:strand:+ start:126 stop:284 length:159 start_codon:yes stop_codon:yes gene_type:complete